MEYLVKKRSILSVLVQGVHKSGTLLPIAQNKIKKWDCPSKLGMLACHLFFPIQYKNGFGTKSWRENDLGCKQSSDSCMYNSPHLPVLHQRSFHKLHQCCFYQQCSVNMQQLFGHNIRSGFPFHCSDIQKGGKCDLH